MRTVLDPCFRLRKSRSIQTCQPKEMGSSRHPRPLHWRGRQSCSPTRCCSTTRRSGSRPRIPFSGGYVGGFNRYRHYTRSYTSADTDIVTPNNDSPYSWAWFDLRREPVVLRAPAVAEDRYYVVQMFDLFTYNFAYVGVRATGSTGANS